MKKIKLILPLVIVSVIAAFAFVSKKPDSINSKGKAIEKAKFADTYFVFTGTNVSQYTDSTKWVRHETNPTANCPGGSLACKIQSATLSTRTQLVSYINTNGITGTSISMLAQKP
ncbi:MAG: hypothetical protein J0I84_13655 [Terrimonas sp.]|nr:hypothetical protein [Terrimonas sp.]OJY92215.1 MAG: hypothetical protein BGP13_08615 [Sphingobacteriales bacterium 40-81]